MLETSGLYSCSSPELEPGPASACSVAYFAETLHFSDFYETYDALAVGKSFRSPAGSVGLAGSADPEIGSGILECRRSPGSSGNLGSCGSLGSFVPGAGAEVGGSGSDLKDGENGGDACV